MNIYVGNLSWELTEGDLRGEFEKFGEVTSAAIIKDKFSGRSRGFGFVEMSNKNEGESAISELNGKEIKGRELRVNEARERTEKGNNGPDRGFGGGGRRY
jgi:RNA recognition motif-containing protein